MIEVKQAPCGRKSCQKNAGRSACAFSLIEMIVALVLCTLLLATLMSILRRSFSELAFSTQQDPSIARIELLVVQLGRDMSNARRIAVGNNRFELAGFGHRDPMSLVATLRSARVLYEIRQDRDRSVLVRVQLEASAGTTPTETTPTGASPTGAPWVELAYIGATSLKLTSNEVRPFSELDRLGMRDTPSERSVGSIPSSVRIELMDQNGRTILDRTFTRERDTR